MIVGRKIFRRKFSIFSQGLEMILEQGTVGKDKSKHMFTALVRSSPSSFFLLTKI